MSLRADPAGRLQFPWRLVIDGDSLPVARCRITRAPRFPSPSKSESTVSCAREWTMSSFERPSDAYFEEFEVGDVYKHWPGKTITRPTTSLLHESR